MRFVVIIISLVALTACSRCGQTPGQPLEGKVCSPDVLSGKPSSERAFGGTIATDFNRAISSECGALGTGATCFVPKGAAKGVCRQYHVETTKQSISWKQAFDSCNALTAGGYKWRLATVQELESLYDGEVYSDHPVIKGSYGRSAAHALSILGKPFEEVFHTSGIVWSSMCADKAERSLMRSIWYQLTGSLYRIDPTDDVDCTAQSSGLGVLVDLIHGNIQTGFAESPHGRGVICVRVP